MRIILLMSVVAGLALPAVGDTLVLQQGQGGYTGCTDSFVRTGGYSTYRNSNYGNATTLQARNERYNGG